MSESGLLTRVAGVLDALGIPFMLSGSIVSSMQGEPRSTHDVDLVVDMSARQVDPLLAAFPPPDFYLSRDSMHEAIARKGMFNLLDVGEGDKVDFWLLTDDPFDQSRFARRRPDVVDGRPIPLSTPEDTILMKLKWARQSGKSERQFRDALGVYEVQSGALDLNYLDNWARQLGLLDDWNRLVSEAETLD
jgi:hypothetical protein